MKPQDWTGLGLILLPYIIGGAIFAALVWLGVEVLPDLVREAMGA